MNLPDTLFFFTSKNDTFQAGCGLASFAKKGAARAYMYREALPTCGNASRRMVLSAIVACVGLFVWGMFAGTFRKHRETFPQPRLRAAIFTRNKRIAFLF
ncbi:MAG: hypothetical protein HQL86_02120 [Magnetococcales bacterium]|nr:hypothetical protein [Magnetococcales bacterium]